MNRRYAVVAHLSNMHRHDRTPNACVAMNSQVPALGRSHRPVAGRRWAAWWRSLQSGEVATASSPQPCLHSATHPPRDPSQRNDGPSEPACPHLPPRSIDPIQTDEHHATGYARLQHDRADAVERRCRRACRLETSPPVDNIKAREIASEHSNTLAPAKHSEPPTTAIVMISNLVGVRTPTARIAPPVHLDRTTT